FGEPIGHVAALARRRAAFSAAHEERLAFVARALMADLEAARLYRLAITDAETQAGNRQLLFARLPEEIRRARRASGPPLALIKLQVAELARLRAAQGDTRAVAALAEIVRRMRRALRGPDWLVRGDDDTFLCVLPVAGSAGAEQDGARIAAAVASAPLVLPAGPTVGLAIRSAAALLCG